MSNFRPMNFNLDYSAWWLIVIALISFGLTFLSYSNKKGFSELSNINKGLMISFRFLSLFMLGFLLMGILFNTTKERVENPIFFVVTDNSKSMLNYKDSNRVLEQVNNFKNKLKKDFGKKLVIKEISIGSKLKTDETISFTESNSNLEKAFEYINTEYYNRNIGGIAFISDGNFNVGANPIYNAERIKLSPIFSFAVGDSIQKRDHLIRNIFHNNIAFYKNKFPVEIDISSYKFNVEEIKVSVELNGKIIDSKQIKYNGDEQDFKKVIFNIPAEKIGFQTYSVHLEEKKNEVSLQNNHKNFYVEVLDSRSKVLILSESPHPDIAALQSVLSKDDNIEIEYKTFESWDKKTNQVNLMICHNPTAQFDSELYSIFKKNKIPVLYILGTKTNRSIYAKLGINFTSRSSNQMDEFQGSFNKGFSIFEADENLKESLSYYPPLTGKYGEFTIPTAASVFIKQRIGPVTKNTPMFFFSSSQEMSFGAIMGEGIWRWKFNEYQRTKNHDVFNSIFSKSIQYLTLRKRGSGLNVIIPRKLNKDEDLVINANFYNNAMEAITSPEIALEITDENGKKYQSQFAINGSGYQAKIGQLNPGKYEWLAETKFGGKSYNQKGNFFVEDLDNEKSESVANHSVLKQLSKQSNGTFYNLNNAQQFYKELSNRKDINTVSYQENTSLNLIDLWWYLLIVAIFLIGEWFMKRFYGLN